MNIALEYADFYNCGYADTGNLYSNDAERIQFILDNLPSSGAKVLDIGCLDGTLAEMYKKSGNDVTAIDISEVSLQKAKDKGINTVLADFMNDREFLVEKQYDVVVCADMIEHFFDTDKCLRKIRRVLVPGGKLILTTPNVCSLPRRLMALIGANPFLEYNTRRGNAGHIRYYTWSNILTQLKDNGFKVVKACSDHVNVGWKSNLLAKIWKESGRSILISATV